VGARQFVTISVLALGWAVGVAAQDMRIQFAEKVALPAAAGHVEFDAYGRRFSLDLESNDRLQTALGATGKLSSTHGRLLRGRLQDTPGSWVRLSKVGDGIEGAIWDGHELYVVTSLSSISANLVQQPDGVGDTVVYRLSDTAGALPDQFCGLEQSPPASAANAPTALEQYESMVAGLRANAAAIASEQLDISIITDAAFHQYYGNLAHDSILSRINMVDGIFSEQVGVMLIPSELRNVSGSSPDPFDSSNPSTLLERLADYREATPAVRAAGLAHLITGRDLDGNVAGIAFRDSLCDAHTGVSLSDSSSGSFYGALIMAHELGHNFGAEHDGVTGSSCAATPQNFLMAPSVNGSGTFSQCSLQSMQGPIARARGRCIGPPNYADLTLDVPASPFVVDASTAFSLPVTVRSHGTLAAQNSVLRINLPSEITFLSAESTTCSVSGSVVTCPLGTLATGENRDVDLRLIGSALRTFTVTASVEADNDFLRSDNVKNVTLGLQSSIDAGASIGAIASPVFVNDPVAIEVVVSSLRTSAVINAQLSIRFVGTFDSLVAGPNSCARSTSDTGLVQCTLADIAPGASTNVTVLVRVPGTGVWNASAFVSAPNDGEFANNRADRSFTVRAEREVTVVSSASESLRTVLGASYQVTYTVTTLGRLPVSDVTFGLRVPSNGEVLSVAPSAGACTQADPQAEWVCPFGALTPGDVRTIVVSYRFNSTGSSSIFGRVQYLDEQSLRSASAFTWVYTYLQLDVSVTLNQLSQQVSEGERGWALINIRSEGYDPAQNVVVTFDIPAPARMSNVRASYNPSGLQCVLVNAQRGRCSGSFRSFQDGYTSAEFEFMSDTPVDGLLRVALTADNDVEPSNNVFEAPLRVLEFLDAGITSPRNDFITLTGQDTMLDLTVTTGRNPVPAVRLNAPGQVPYLDLVSIRVNGVDCPLTDVPPYSRTVCVIGDLPANASVPVSVTYRARSQQGDGTIYLTVMTARDSNRDNNEKQVRFRSMEPTDVQLTVQSAPASGDSGATFAMPRITVSSSSATAQDVVVEIPLPAFAQVASVSTNGFCTGATTLRCSLPSIAAGSSASLNIVLLGTAVGSFTSNVTVSAANDSTAGNNSAAVSISVTAPPPAPTPPGGSSSGGGKSGGGGSLEWSGLAFLAMLGWLATVRRSSTRTRCASRPATTTAR
jgi:hypothetical protein